MTGVPWCSPAISTNGRLPTFFGTFRALIIHFWRNLLSRPLSKVGVFDLLSLALTWSKKKTGLPSLGSVLKIPFHTSQWVHEIFKTKTKTMRSKNIKLKYNAGHKRACQDPTHKYMYMYYGARKNPVCVQIAFQPVWPLVFVLNSEFAQQCPSLLWLFFKITQARTAVTGAVSCFPAIPALINNLNPFYLAFFPRSCSGCSSFRKSKTRSKETKDVSL